MAIDIDKMIEKKEMINEKIVEKTKKIKYRSCNSRNSQ